MKGSIIKESLPNGITFEYVNGEHYYKIYFGDNWKLDIGESFIQSQFSGNH